MNKHVNVQEVILSLHTGILLGILDVVWKLCTNLCAHNEFIFCNSRFHFLIFMRRSLRPDGPPSVPQQEELPFTSTHLLLLRSAIDYISHSAFGQLPDELSQLVRRFLVVSFRPALLGSSHLSVNTWDILVTKNGYF